MLQWTRGCSYLYKILIANHASDKWLISKKNKELLNSVAYVERYRYRYRYRYKYRYSYKYRNRYRYRTQYRCRYTYRCRYRSTYRYSYTHSCVHRHSWHPKTGRVEWGKNGFLGDVIKPRSSQPWSCSVLLWCGFSLVTISGKWEEKSRLNENLLVKRMKILKTIRRKFWF